LFKPARSFAARHATQFVALALLAVLPGIASAYVGPGAGVSALGALWGLIVGVVMALGIVLFWPIRIMLRKRKAAKEAAQETAEEGVKNPETNEDSAQQRSSEEVSDKDPA